LTYTTPRFTSVPMELTQSTCAIL